MRKLTSKNVIAIGITPRIDEYKRDLIQEFIDGSHPLSSHRKTEDSGARRKVFLEQSPVGPNETGGPGDRLSNDGVSSGGTQGIDPGGKDKQETGPGNSPGADADPEQEWTSPDTVNQIFGNDDDLSDKFSPLNSDSRQRDVNATHHLRKLHSRPTPVQSIPFRLPVDEPVRRRKAASSDWTYIYV